MIRLLIAFFIIVLLSLPTLVSAADSTEVEVVVDSAQLATPNDSLDSIEPTVDSLTDSSAVASFNERYEEYKKRHVERTPSFSFFDTVVAYFASERSNVHEARSRASFHDVGDYFRSDPSYFTLDHQETPMRKTVQPFGLAGDRLNLVVNRQATHPFEHVIEPDGLIDLNDLPSSFDHDIYLLPGPVGRLLGGRQMVATLVTLPEEPSGDNPVTSISADKGDYVFSWVRGRYSRRFSRGRSMNLALGYRKADGPVSGRADDSYHYIGDMFFPIGGRHGIKAQGRLYSRDGWQDVRSDIGGQAIPRDRFDRHATVSVERSLNEGSGRWLLGYKHLRQGSFSEGAYLSRYNQTGNGGFMAREWLSGRTAFNLRLDGDYLEYENYQDLWSKTWADFTFDMIRLGDGVRYGLSIGGRYDDDFSFLPNAAAVIHKDASGWFVSLSVGYAEREPSLSELFLPEQQAAVYNESTRDYANVGNRELEPEKQLIGNIRAEYGSVQNAVGLDVTGGMIENGIDWQQIQDADSIGSFTRFSPINGDVEFVSATVHQRLKYRDLATLTSGGSYHYVDYAEFEDRAYLPEYQAFAGMELHHYLQKQRIHLFAYGEVIYVGPYHGYVVQNLGEELIVNAKFSVGLTNFRFHLVFQNMLNQAYLQRDHMTFRGSFFYYGLVWNFDD
ncbi:MAG: TonB-dependent receptor [candidate division Zixibacteria bacterium]|nr:TonB-dependent receptor [candidate division Zixibacteria bacterium]MDH3939009.1 TonB-dependent receptor [candidate division Zixibacteria bacterium]MDH4033258.1 TonB-dependent receptor [candidate division Zixibacteria bacterium]